MTTQTQNIHFILAQDLADKYEIVRIPEILVVWIYREMYREFNSLYKDYLAILNHIRVTEENGNYTEICWGGTGDNRRTATDKFLSGLHCQKSGANAHGKGNE